MNNVSDESIKLALDVAVSQFGNKLNLSGTDDFVKATIEVLATDSKYANISLDNPEHQEMLESRRLDIEIDNAMDLDLDSIPDLDLTNVPDLDLDEQTQQPKQRHKTEKEQHSETDVSHKRSHDWGMSL